MLYEETVESRRSGFAAQVLMSVEGGQVYFGHSLSSGPMFSFHETQSQLLLALAVDIES